MSGNKLVDSAFLAQLIQGSFEVRWGAVTEAISENADLFGGPETEIIATFDRSIIAASPDGTFYRAEWAIDEETGKVVFSDVEDLEVPVYEASELGPHVRQQALEAVDAILGGRDDEADERLSSLMGMVASGAKLTAEGVEDHLFRQTTAREDADWYKAVVENEDRMRAFVGAEAGRLPTATSLFEGADPTREQVEHAIRSLGSKLGSIWDRLTLAVEVNESYEAPRDQMGVVEFVEFVSDYVLDLDETLGLVEEALAVVEDGDPGILARVHDGVAARFPEFALTAAFVEKLARRFKAPSQAA